MLRTNLIISCKSTDDCEDDVSVLSTPSVLGEEVQDDKDVDVVSKGNEKKIDQIVLDHRNKDLTNLRQCDRLFTSSVLGRAEMLSSKLPSGFQENEDNQSQPRYLTASELKRQRLRRCLKHSPTLPSQNQQHGHSEQLTTSKIKILNSAEKSKAFLSEKQPKSNRKNWNKTELSPRNNRLCNEKDYTKLKNEDNRDICRECFLPIAIFRSVGKENSRDNFQCTCFLPPPPQKNSKENRNQKLPGTKPSKCSITPKSSEQEEETSLTVKPLISPTSLEKDKAQKLIAPFIAPPKLSKEHLMYPSTPTPKPTPENLVYLPTNISNSFCSSSLQYSTNTSNTEENNSIDENDDLFGPPSLIRTASSAEETFFPREDERQEHGYAHDILHAVKQKNSHSELVGNVKISTSFSNISISSEQKIHVIEYEDNLNPVNTDKGYDHDHDHQNFPSIKIVEKNSAEILDTSQSKPNMIIQKTNRLQNERKEEQENVDFFLNSSKTVEPRYQVFCKFWQSSNNENNNRKKKKEHAYIAKDGEKIENLNLSGNLASTKFDDQLEETLSLSSFSSSSLLETKLVSIKKKWMQLSSSSNSTVATKTSTKKTWRDNLRWRKKSTVTTSNTDRRCTIVDKKDKDNVSEEDTLLLLRETPDFLDTKKNASIDIFVSATYTDGIFNEEKPKPSTYQSVIDKETTIHEFVHFHYELLGKTQALVVHFSKAAKCFYMYGMFMESLYTHQQALLTSLAIEGYGLEQAFVLCNNIACSLAACLQYSQAESYFRYALSSDNSNHNSIALINLGQIYLIQNDYLMGHKCLNQALQQLKFLRSKDLAKVEYQVLLAKQGEVYNYSAPDFVLLEPQQLYEF